MATSLVAGVVVVFVCLLAAAFYAFRRAGAQRAVVAVVARAGRMWRGPCRSGKGSAETVSADVMPADWRPFRNTPRDLLDSIRRDVASGGSARGGADAFVARATGGEVLPSRLLASFAAQQAQALASDRRSLFYLATRFTDTGGATFFAKLAETCKQATDLLGNFTDSLGARRSELRGREPLPGCQAYPAFVAWLSLNAAAEDAALALTVSLRAWGDSFAALARGLRSHPGFPAIGALDQASAFFGAFDLPDEGLEANALAIVREAQDAGRRPDQALSYARMLDSYQGMFWNTLVEEADGSHGPGGPGGRGGRGGRGGSGGDSGE